MADTPTGGTATATRSDTGPVQLSDVTTTPDAVAYDDDGALVTSGKNPRRIALAADATDPDVGWTVQHLESKHAEKRPDAMDYPYPSLKDGAKPDQTFHPDELPDPNAALRSGLLPQNTRGLNVDAGKFKDAHGFGDG